ncbi:MAG: hypothetical protein O9304_01525 [Microcystis sp. LE19-114.1B]|nr:hypothetical protein [Microcystis sp. LE19-114.1B]
MSQIRLYLDEDADQRSVVEALRNLRSVRYGTCALIMYLLGERSSPLHCGQNPLL